MTLFTIITGLAGILSLFLPFIPNLKRWKVYFFYFAFLSLGVTLGIIACMSEKAINYFTGDQLLQLIVFVTILSVGTFISYYMIKQGKEGFGYVVLLLILGIYLPMNIDKIKTKPEIIDSNDVLLLSKQYQDKGDYQKSGDYLKMYKKNLQEKLDTNQLELIKTKIKYLDSMQLNNFK